METGEVLDSQISASSEGSLAYASMARLNGRYSWCSSTGPDNEFIQVRKKVV